MQIDKESVTETVKRKISKTQKDWIDFFNSKGKKMISAPDIYSIAKEGNKKLLKSLAKDCDEHWVVTSTRIVYSKENLEAEIIHDADSTVVSQTSTKLIIPFLDEQAVNSLETEKYLQALFGTTESFDEIVKTLKSFNEEKKLYLWTPTQESRATRPVRSVGLFFNGLGFLVDGSNWVDGDNGFSRGVTIDSAPKEQTKVTEEQK